MVILSARPMLQGLHAEVAMLRILESAPFLINAYNPATQFGRTEQSWLSLAIIFSVIL
jgi:hypothetical protein